MYSIHVSKFIRGMHKGVVDMMNVTIVQNDVIMGWCIKSMNMAMDAQYVYVIMQLMVDNMIILYEYAIKEDHIKFAKEMNKLIYHG